MSETPIRVAYGIWGKFNESLIEAVRGLSEEELALTPGRGFWPLWAMVGHMACQRVFGFCDFAGEPGAETTPFTNASYLCPGDEDLEHAMDASQLVEALESTFRIVDRCLDSWTIESLSEVIDHSGDFGEGWVHSRAWVVQRAFAHDIHHGAEVWQLLGMRGLSKPDLWDWGEWKV